MQYLSKGQKNQGKNKKQAINNKEFKTLDEKIKNGEANDVEAKRFAELALIYAKNEVKDYNFSPEEQEKLLKEKWPKLGEENSD